MIEQPTLQTDHELVARRGLRRSTEARKGLLGEARRRREPSGGLAGILE